MTIHQFPINFKSYNIKQELDRLQQNKILITNQDCKIIPLVSVGGTVNVDYSISGPVKQTNALRISREISIILASLSIPISRSWIISPHNFKNLVYKQKYNFHLFKHSLICIPLSKSNTRIQIEGTSHLMECGKGYFVHDYLPYDLEFDGQNSSCLFVEIKKSLQNIMGNKLHYKKMFLTELSLDNTSYFEVLSCEDIKSLTQKILMELEKTDIVQEQSDQIKEKIADFCSQWKTTFQKFGHSPKGELAYNNLIVFFKKNILIKLRKWLRRSKAIKQIVEIITTMLQTTDRIQSFFLKKMNHSIVPGSFSAKFDRPIIIVAAPRSGSTLLFESISRFEEIWTIGGESHEIIESIPSLHPSHQNFTSHELTKKEASPEVISVLHRLFTVNLKDNRGNPLESESKKIRFLEKTPKNALRILFFSEVFPDALFIFLYRSPYENISSLIEGWRSQCFISGYAPIPDWPYHEWSFVMPQNWRSLRNSSLVEIASYQWKYSNLQIIKDLQSIPNKWHFISYDNLIKNYKGEMKKIAKFGNLSWNDDLENIFSFSPPVANLNVSSPYFGKWKKHEEIIKSQLPYLKETIQQADFIKKNF